MRRVMLFMFVSAVAAMVSAAEQELEVHEWGVWVRNQTTHGTVLAAPKEEIDGLPGFVLRHEHDKEYPPKEGQEFEWHKPVLHFYGSEGLAVSVKVQTPQGNPTAYYPLPRFLETKTTIIDGLREREYSLQICSGLEWTGTLSAQAAGKLPQPEKDHWWHNLRQVPAQYFNTAAGCERFIFYEATARQEPLLTGRVGKDDCLTLHNAHTTASGRALLIANDGVRRYLRIIKGIEAAGTLKLRREELMQAPVTDEALLQAAREQWISFGMNAEEARAIVNTWKPDPLGTPGFLLISCLPAEVYDAMFPLTITPRPSRVVRAGVIFDTLPGEDERLEWLPALWHALEERSAKFADEDFEIRQNTKKYFRRLGDLTRPLLQKLLADDDAEVRAAASSLLKEMKPIDAGPLLEPVPGKPNTFIRRAGEDSPKSLNAKRKRLRESQP